MFRLIAIFIKVIFRLGLFAFCLLGFCWLISVYFPFGSPNPKLQVAPEVKYLDMHVHAAGIGAGGSGCFLSQAMLTSYKLPFYLRAFGVTKAELEKHGDRLQIERLSAKIRESKFISKAIVLALDGVIDQNGNLDLSKTEVYVPNDYVKSEVKKYDNLLFGASINPYRKNAIDLLKTQVMDGAKLVKWIPSIMNIDPADPKIEDFYREMVQLKIPLLVHVGNERTFTHAKDELADPSRLKLPLSLGVTVIAAHIATTGEIEGTENFLRIQPLFKDFSNLYTDISSLTQINKLGYLSRALEFKYLRSRLLYGSDWPLQFFPLVSPWYHFPTISAADAQYIAAQKNPWDRDVLTKKALGVDESIFKRSAELFEADK